MHNFFVKALLQHFYTVVNDADATGPAKTDRALMNISTPATVNSSYERKKKKADCVFNVSVNASLMQKIKRKKETWAGLH